MTFTKEYLKKIVKQPMKAPHASKRMYSVPGLVKKWSKNIKLITIRLVSYATNEEKYKETSAKDYVTHNNMIDVCPCQLFISSRF